MNPSKMHTGAQLSGENPVNNPKPKGYQGYNKFNRNYPHKTTARYGDVTPFFVENTVEKDIIPLMSQHEVRTPTMVSPFLGNITMKKAYFDVPLRAIYPLNYDLMKVPPVAGDDVPIENTAFIRKSFFVSLEYALQSLAELSDTTFVYHLMLLERFFSKASLFDRLGCHLSSCFSLVDPDALISDEFDVKYESFDLMFELISDRYFKGSKDGALILTDTEKNIRYVPLALKGRYENLVNTVRFVSIRRILEILRENPLRYRPNIITVSDFAPYADFGGFFSNLKLNVKNDINIERIIAYQLACIEFMTDDHIDNIYSTDLFRNQMTTYFRNVFISDGGSVPTFLRNGVTMQYDCFSSEFWNIATTIIENSYGEIYGMTDLISYIFNLLAVRKSLRYEDYFVGGRLRPIAMGDVNIPVSGTGVSAFEVTRGLVWQRYLNSVNLSGPELDEYSKEILHSLPPARTDVPKMIGMTMSSVRGYEVENTTSQNQGALVTNMRSSDERFGFKVEMDHESILIGVVFFEVPRIYSKTVDRHFYHLDRYDKFNPKTQYLGDQDISLAELRADQPFDEPFAYGVRNGEYKQRFGVVSGGVVDFLKSWVMVTDTEDSYDDEDNLNEDYIRSKNVEFDRFFDTANTSDAGYFHFILDFMNVSETSRAMDVAPAPLI